MFRVRDKRNNKWVGNGEKFYLNRTDDLIQVKRKFFKTKEVFVRPSNYEYRLQILAFARKNKLLKDSEPNLSGEDIREGLTAIISVKIEDPQFEGQT